MAASNARTIAGRSTVDEATVAQLRSDLRGPVLVPGDESYDETRRLWNAMIDRRPAIIARCAGTADVVEAVRFAREHDLLVAIRGGGHNVAGTGSCDGGLMIDLSLMRGVHVDSSTRTARVQGGATWGDVDSEAQVFGLAVPGGVVSTTGVAGLTLGGGMGWQMRKRGLTIDNLLSADVVTAEGEVLHASEDENADLFWALRGGGGNFGVVTSFEFRAHEVGPMVHLCCPMYPADIGAASLTAWREFMETAPEEFGASFLFWSIPDSPYFPAEVRGSRVAIPLAIYIGDPAEGDRLTAPLRRLGKPLVDLTGTMPWTAVQAMFDPFVPNQGLHYYWKSLYLDRLDAEAIDDIGGWASEMPSAYTYTPILPLGGAVSRVPAESTAFGRRDMPYVLELDSMWATPEETERNIDWTRRAWSGLQRFSDGSLYLNFPGLGEEGERMVRSALGEANFGRLAEIKARYDPANFFRVNLNIPPSRAESKYLS